MNLFVTIFVTVCCGFPAIISLSHAPARRLMPLCSMFAFCINLADSSREKEDEPGSKAQTFYIKWIKKDSVARTSFQVHALSNYTHADTIN